MYTMFHEICGVSIETTAPCAIPENAQGALFRSPPGPAQLRLCLEPADELPDPSGSFRGEAGEKQVWLDGRTVIRRTCDCCRPTPHMEAHYDLDAPRAVKAVVRREDWPWAVGTKYLWSGMALNQLLLHFRTLFFHASYVADQGQGILFTAPSGTGKSTQAELWRVHRGAEVINGDKAGISLGEVPTIHSIPFSGTSGLCQNRSLPLKAVVVLSQAPVNRVTPMTPSQTLQALCPNVFVDQLVPEEWSLALNLLLDLSMTVPVYSLACTPDVRAVEALEQAIQF